MENKYKYSEEFFWGIILFGILSPLLVRITAELISNPKEFFDFLSSVFPSLMLIGLFNCIPFVVIAFMVKALWNRPSSESYQVYFPFKSGVMMAGMITIVINIIFNIYMWIIIVRQSPGFSTSVIAYFTFPFILLITIPIEYGVGWIIGKLILKIKQ